MVNGEEEQTIALDQGSAVLWLPAISLAVGR